MPFPYVASFKELSERFITHYKCFVRPKLSVANLFHVKMKIREPIREFMKRFDVIILQSESVNIEFNLKAVKEAIQLNTQFFVS